jgi:gluconate 2-dehydrogenase gamma chain
MLHCGSLAPARHGGYPAFIRGHALRARGNDHGEQRRGASPESRPAQVPARIRRGRRRQLAGPAVARAGRVGGGRCGGARCGAAFLHLSPLEAAGLDAIAARIIPTDETPGAREAGVIHFIDQALGDYMAEAAGELRAGLESLDALAMGAFEGERFASLEPAAQDALLREIEETPFFGLMQFLTVAGMFALPSYGGNRDYIGWQLLGLSHQHAWLPPFGHYDAERMGVPFPETDASGGHGHG